MKCRTCHFCQVLQRNVGFCHGLPPQATPMRYYFIDGQERIEARPGMVIGIYPASSQGVLPPIHPSESWCGLHRFSIFTWLAWKRAEAKELPPILHQDKPAGVNP